MAGPVLTAEDLVETNSVLIGLQICRFRNEEVSNMPGQFARLFQIMTPLHRAFPIVTAPLESCSSDEISEYDGVLLVRLRAGRAMQVRLRGSDVLTRTVPIAKATQIGGYSPWQLASASRVQAWIQSNAAIWHWLVAKGIDVEATKARLAEAMIPKHNAVSVFSPRGGNEGL
jgi:hypothetical protein